MRPTIGSLLAQQDRDTRGFCALVKAMHTSIGLLEFPLCSPSKHFELSDILAALDDWLVLMPQSVLENRAADIVAADQELEEQTRNDTRRALGGE